MTGTTRQWQAGPAVEPAGQAGEAPPAQDGLLTVVHHQLCRPPPNAFDTLRLDETGEWHPDDGLPGLAFSHRLVICVTGGPPMASAVRCRCGGIDCTGTLAMAKTRERWGSANGSAVPPVVASSP